MEPGQTLGHYTIVEQIGVGGMGEVYRARDNTLGREVALKILPAAFAADADRVARFQREAKLLASLNHPNIAAIHSVVQDGDVLGLALELVIGDDLTVHLENGTMSLDKTLAYAEQIAAAVEAAHEQGVVHRDLKPANIKIAQDGAVKVLDFGLAKATDCGRRLGQQSEHHDFALAGQCAAHARWRDSRHGGLHVARTGPRLEPRPAHGYFFVRGRPV